MRFRRPAIAATLLMGCALPLMAATTASAAAAAPSLCAPPSDTVGPVITQVTFGQPSIDLNSGSRTQTVAATATDSSGKGAASGVARVLIEIRGNRFGKGLRLKLTSGTAASGTWTGQFTISKFAHPGTYHVEYLDAEDAARNSQEYSGYGTTPRGPNDLALHPNDDPSFAVTGTPAHRPPRKPAGNLKDLSISPSSVDTTSSPRHVHVTATFKGAQPTRVVAELFTARRSKASRSVYLNGVLRDHHGTWAAAVHVPQWLGTQVLHVELYADYGRSYRPYSRRYDTDQLRRLHFPTKVTVVSGLDKTPPKLTSLTFSPASIDSTDGPEQVTVTAEATDAGSGVREIDVNSGIRHGLNGASGGLYPRAAAGVGFLSNENFHVRLKKNSNGDWVGTTTVRRCVPSGTYKLTAELRDGARNYHFYSTKQLAKAGITSTVDVTSKHGDVAAPYVYSAATYGADENLFLNFSEGVANVSTSTLSVFPLSPRSTRFTTQATITDLACANGTHTVDCSGSGGLITSAKLTISDFKPGTSYQVYANLNEVTPQLVDGNGNPMGWNYDQAEVRDS
jgi:hypothetical protein